MGISRSENIFVDSKGSRSGGYSRGCSGSEILGRLVEMGDRRALLGIDLSLVLFIVGNGGMSLLQVV